MEVILLKDNEYGDKGAVVKVSDGFARNFLFPAGAAIPRTESNLQHVRHIAVQRQKKLEKEKAEVQALADKITKSAEIVLKAKGSESGQLFGAITHQQIAEAVKSAAGTEIDRRRIQLKSIREAGNYNVPIRLTFGLTAAVKIKVVAEVDKKAEPAAKKRKPRKKEEIAADIEAQEKAAATPQAADAASSPS